MKSWMLGIPLSTVVLLSGLARPVSVNESLAPFTDVTEQAGVAFRHYASTPMETGGGAAFLDYDNDDDLDIYVTGGGGANALFRNNGDGTFTDVTEQAGVADVEHISRGIAYADYDNDGDEDLYVLNEGPNVLYRNNGDGTFTDVTAEAGVGDPSRSQCAAFGDYDDDGWLDIYVGNYVDMETIVKDRFSCQANKLYHNNGDGSFTEVATALGVANAGCALAVTFTDYDDDGDLDIYVGNDFGPKGYPINVLYRNDGAGEDRMWLFTNVSREANADARLYSMGIAVGDYDNDGDLDYYITSIIGNVFYRNNGNGTFTDVVRENGTHVTKAGRFARINWGTGFFDYDNDGYEDLYVVSGPIFSRNPQGNLLFLNHQDGTFTDIAADVGVDHPGVGRGCIFADYDNDGDVDFLLTNYNQEVVLYRNEYYQADYGLAKNNWLQIKLIGRRSNRDGIGARVHVEAGRLSQIREVGSGSPHSSQSGLVANFGLGQAGVAKRVEIRWPSGILQQLDGVGANQRLRLVEPEAQDDP